MNYLVMSLTKELQDLSSENYKTLLKNLKINYVNGNDSTQIRASKMQYSPTDLLTQNSLASLKKMTNYFKNSHGNSMDSRLIKTILKKEQS